MHIKRQWNLAGCIEGEGLYFAELMSTYLAFGAKEGREIAFCQINVHRCELWLPYDALMSLHTTIHKRHRTISVMIHHKRMAFISLILSAVIYGFGKSCAGTHWYAAGYYENENHAKKHKDGKQKALQWWTWLLDRMKAYDGLSGGSPAHVHQAPVMYEPIADPFNRLSVHISHQRAPVTTVIAIANIAILIISAIMIYTLLLLLFAKSSLQSFQLHLYFHFSQKNCPSLLSLSTVTPYCCNQSGS